LLHPSEWSVGVEGEEPVAVDKRRTCLDAPREDLSALLISTPDRAAKAKLRVVHSRQRFFLVAVAQDRDGRPELLLPNEACVVVETAHNRWQEKVTCVWVEPVLESPAVVNLATSTGAVRKQLLDVPLLLVVVYRPHRDRRVEAVPHNVGIEASDERVHEILGETLRRVDPLYAEAELTRCGEGAPNEVADQILVQRDVVQQDGCVVATKLERQVFD